MRKQNPGAPMKITLSFLLLALSVAPAAAQITGSTGHARRKPQGTVSSDIVRIGDLVENAGVAASTPAFRAPGLGQTGAVPARAVPDAVRPSGALVVEVPGLA